MAGLSSHKGVKVIKLPNLGEGLREARVIEIFKKEGDTVAQDDPLCEVETDKAIFPVESSVAGVIGKWLVSQDDDIQVGQEIVEIITTDVTAASANGGAEVIQKADDGHITEKGALSPEVIRQLSGVLQAGLGVVAGWEGLREGWSKVRGRSTGGDRKSTRLNSSHIQKSRMPSSA